MKQTLFSILHTSARPDKWRAVYDDWMQNAVHPEDVEYVLVIDDRWGFDLSDMSPYSTPLNNIRVLRNTGRRCYVDGVNIAAKGSTGAILVVNADDQFSCPQWDDCLRYAFIDSANEQQEWVIEVDCGGNEHERGIMPMPVLSRARYEKLGYVFFPEYESMMADNDFCQAAYQDHVVIDARHLLFPHKHPMYESNWQGTQNDPRWDEAYQEQNRREARELGRRIFERRKACGFAARRRRIALCLPGERFEGPYLDAILDLQAHLLIDLDMEVVKLRHYETNVYITREDIRRAVAQMEVKPDLLWWQDDDNPVSVAHFDQLMADLDARSDVDGVAGWCWIHDSTKEHFLVSCGHWSPDHLHWDPFPSSFAHERSPVEFETGGLPAILMRYSAIEKAGEGSFLPIVDRRLLHGLSGEDVAFFKRAEEGGAKFLVDPTVRVPHLKYVTVEPILPSEGKTPVKVACMMRVKNEARWIKRTIDSVRELCGDLIFVMEDNSVDDTRAIAQAAGAVVLDSPFAHLPIGESRDKDWLLHQVIERCHPDWILMPDGDEELEPGAAAKLRRVLETNPPCDCLALRFLFFWDSIEQIRVDGGYGTLRRQSLFRANENFRFTSYYSKEQTPNQNHVGLHCSNAPGLGGKVMGVNVALLHYGYLHREDRIRKYKWITSIDPANEGEDFYRHCVQGDLPEFPADAVYKHGGPLQFAKLPAHAIPKFENGVPGPFDPARVGVSSMFQIEPLPGGKLEFTVDKSIPTLNLDPARQIEAARRLGFMQYDTD
jgi:Glycosyl transferase family 2